MRCSAVGGGSLGPQQGSHLREEARSLTFTDACAVVCGCGCVAGTFSSKNKTISLGWQLNENLVIYQGDRQHLESLEGKTPSPTLQV